MKTAELPDSVVSRRAVVYVRQSTMTQVHENLESQRRQYELVELARSYGFADVVTIDEDLGRSASGLVARPGFTALVAQLCEGVIGAVFCLEASRLARNGREWHHLLELCGLVGARVVDVDGVYDPGHPNDRLLLGLKGTMSEFELTLIRRRLVDGAFAKARRGEFRLRAPIGYLWSRDTGLEMDPDLRVQDAVRNVFRLFARLGTARATHVHMLREKLLFPRPCDGYRRSSGLRWAAPAYSHVKNVLNNPFYAGAYAYGKSTHKTEIVEGRLQKTYGHDRAIEAWPVLIKDHHAPFITWQEFERNQELLRKNSFGKLPGRPKAARGGRALLGGLLRCRRCGRMLSVSYSGNGRHGRYQCRQGNLAFGFPKCISVSAARPDDIVAAELMRVVEPLAIEAAMNAIDLAQRQAAERTRALELELQQAEYEVQLALRRYNSVDPDNRLVAAELEARWNAALTRLRDTELRIEAQKEPAVAAPVVDPDALLRLAGDLHTAWEAPTTDTGVKQRLIRTLVEEIVVDVDAEACELVLLIHWRGGRHSELRAKKPKRGDHRRHHPPEASALIREMAGAWSDEHIAATLNRMGLKTGQGNTWNRERVKGFRNHVGLPAPSRVHERDVGEPRVTMQDAAVTLGVNRALIRELIDAGVLPAKQLAPDAPWQIRASDLELPAVKEAARARKSGRRPRHARDDDRNIKIPGT